MPRKGRRTKAQYLADLHAAKRTRAIGFLARMISGRCQKEVAQDLGIAPATVKKYICWLYEELGASTNAQAVAICFRKGLLK